MFPLSEEWGSDNDSVALLIGTPVNENISNLKKRAFRSFFYVYERTFIKLRNLK